MAHNTVEQWLSVQSARLSEAGIQTARLDCLVLLEDETGLSRAHLLANNLLALNNLQLEHLEKALEKRLQHQPLAYIRGFGEFYGRRFTVNGDVLVPRPESETIVDLVLNIPDIGRNGLVILDIGCGSGCLGLTLGLEIPSAKVILSDISGKALKVCQANAKQLGVTNIEIVQRSLLKSAPICDVVVANLPYVPIEYPVNKAAQQEPSMALFSGKDGLDDYREFWRQILAEFNLHSRPKHVVVEALPEQHSALEQLAEKAGYQLIASQDYIQHFSMRI